ncbi:MAG TPA: glycosyltransferase [Stellaceae bacterium]
MAATIIGAAVGAIWLYLILFRGGFWRVRPEPAPGSCPPCSVVAVIPARDEAEVVGRAVESLLTQRFPGSLQVILVDDHSADGTGAIARAAAEEGGAADRLTVLAATPLPAGWTGKLWAVRQGVEAARRLGPDYLLLTDADIVHAPSNVAELVARAEHGRYALVSLMVRLHCRSMAERLLIPAFVFFFFMLYPPRWVADPGCGTAAAAGGCMLICPDALDRIGGIDSIRGEIIDDCALASRVKPIGRIWLGATEDTISIREYADWHAIWHMISRCAFAQLGYSGAALLGTVAGMCLVYLAPPLLLLSGSTTAGALGAVAWVGMGIAFYPVLRLYRRTVLYAALLPGIAVFYTAATIASAILFWRGRGGSWKGRFQAEAHR